MTGLRLRDALWAILLAVSVYGMHVREQVHCWEHQQQTIHQKAMADGWERFAIIVYINAREAGVSRAILDRPVPMRVEP